MNETYTKVDQFIGFESFPSTSCCSQNFPPNKMEKFGWLDVQGSIRNFYIEWVAGMDWQEKVTIQNSSMALVKPKIQSGGVMLVP